MKKVILSFDYELFFGTLSGTVQKTLIDPTNALLEAMESVNLKGNFFVDWQMLKYIGAERDERCREDYRMIVNQLKDIIHRGHRIELHIHPHWVDAKYNGNGTWDFSDFSHYSLNSFSEDEITQMFIEGSQLLTSIAQEVSPNYKICAFRAGGWAVQPFSKLKKGFLSTGIVVDSSTAFGFHNVLPDSFYDFSNMPHKSIYRFNDDVCNDDGGTFIEVPITTYRMTFLNYLQYKLLQKKYVGYQKRLTDGTHDRKQIGRGEQKSVVSRFLDRFRRYRMLTFSQEYPFITNSFIRHSSLEYYCFIDHPKDLSKFTTTSIVQLGQKGYTCCSYWDVVCDKVI